MLQFAAAFLFDVAQLHTQGHELFEVAVFACERLFVSGQRVLQCVDLRFQLPSRFVGLPLGKRLVQGNVRGLVVAGVEQVHGHVERGSEARVQRVDTLG